MFVAFAAVIVLLVVIVEMTDACTASSPRLT